MDVKFRPHDCLFKRLPERTDPRMWLYAVLGPALFKEYQRRFGGRKIWMPKSGTALPCRYCSHRARHLRLLKRRGWNARRLARRFDLTTKRVYELLR